MSRMKKACFALLSLAAWLAPLAGEAWASDGITLIISGADKIIYLPAVLAERLGYFKEQGLAVTVASDPVGVEAEDELLAGATDGVAGFYDHTISLQAKGKFTECVVQMGLVPGEVELVSRRQAASLRTPGDPRGLTVGVTGLGSSTVVLMRYLAQKAGLSTRNLTVLPVGSGDQFIAAMRGGQIDLGMTTEPTASRLLKSGEAEIVADIRTPEGSVKALGGLYPAACVYMQSAWVESHRGQVQKLVNAIVKSLVFIGGHSAEEIADLVPERFLAGDRQTYVQALSIVKKGFSPDGAMPAEGPALVLSVLEAVSPSLRDRKVDLSRTFTNEFVGSLR